MSQGSLEAHVRRSKRSRPPTRWPRPCAGAASAARSGDVGQLSHDLGAKRHLNDTVGDVSLDAGGCAQNQALPGIDVTLDAAVQHNVRDLHRALDRAGLAHGQAGFVPGTRADVADDAGRRGAGRRRIRRRRGGARPCRSACRSAPACIFAEHDVSSSACSSTRSPRSRGTSGSAGRFPCGSSAPRPTRDRVSARPGAPPPGRNSGNTGSCTPAHGPSPAVSVLRSTVAVAAVRLPSTLTSDRPDRHVVGAHGAHQRQVQDELACLRSPRDPHLLDLRPRPARRP